MTKAHVSALARAFAPLFKAVAARIASIEEQLKSLEALGSEPVPGRDGRDGRDGAAGEKGADGINGKDGRDGLGFEDFAVEYDGDRAFAFVLQRGEERKTFPFVAPFVLDRGVFKHEAAYQRGDGVTYGGSFWIAQKDVAAGSKPGDGSQAWRLAVKQGREGKQGQRGEKGVDGRDGKDGANMNERW